ncbi:MAG TPA: gamma-glutamyl-gamma-aminobutyrate hydrolase family protein, partial [Glycomyces sp.]|nr:gamma-glutamyl-gamma-aminobutyrate hydrolase family protein [Glycomyces sp.]
SPEGAAKALSGVDALLVPGGFGERGVPGKIGALTYARTNLVPTLGLCLGLQCMAIEGLRELAGLTEADSEEFNGKAEHLVISTMADQTDIVAGRGDMGGTMRLGTYPARLVEGSLVAEAYGTTEVAERHRHRYEVNNAYRDQLVKAGFVISGLSPDGRLVEFIELDRERHPYFVATQAHPELKSRPTRPHPLFDGLVAAALKRAAAEQLDLEPEAA